MDADVKAEWVAALRSGEYTQAQDQLCTRNGAMCCLGVLIDVAIDGEWILTPGGYEFDGQHGDLSNVAMADVGLSADEARRLITMNDDDRETFYFIADFIEANL